VEQVEQGHQVKEIMEEILQFPLGQMPLVMELVVEVEQEQ
tara:strand:+ start:282 stop:401 length:120 start_codon:yes stop_codon:yes gene_type:complete